MLEKLNPGDRIMNVPAKGDVNLLVPYGACGIVVEGEGMLEAVNLDGTITVLYGCSIEFENQPKCVFAASGYWFRVREGLMKISPDESLEKEEQENIILDSIPPLVTIEQANQLIQRNNNA